MLPLFSFFLDSARDRARRCSDFAGAVVVLEVLLFSYEKVPFTCTYMPSENLKAFGIPYVVDFLLGASIFAGMERTALQDPAAGCGWSACSP